MDFKKIREEYQKRDISHSSDLWEKLASKLDDDEIPHSSKFWKYCIGLIFLIFCALSLFLLPDEQKESDTSIDLLNVIAIRELEKPLRSLEIPFLNKSAIEENLTKRKKQLSKESNSKIIISQKARQNLDTIMPIIQNFALEKLSKFKIEHAIVNVEANSKNNQKLSEDDEIDKLLNDALVSLSLDKKGIEIVQNLEKMTDAQLEQWIVKTTRNNPKNIRSEKLPNLSESDEMALIEKLSRELLLETESEINKPIFEKIYLAVQKRFKNRKTSKSS